MSDNLRINLHGERLAKLENRMDNHDKSYIDVKEEMRDFRKEQKWQTKQIFMGLGGLGVLYVVLQFLIKK